MSTPWLDRAMTFEPDIGTRDRLKRNNETFAQYIVRVMSYSCPTCGAHPMTPCDEKIANSKSCGVQFHRARAKAAKCPITKSFLEHL